MAIVYNIRIDENERLLTAVAPNDENIQHYLRFQLTETDLQKSPSLQIRLLGYEYYHAGKKICRASQMFIIRYVVDGEGTFNGKKVEKGMCYFSIPGVEYTIESSESNPIRQYWIELFGTEAPKYLYDIFGSVTPDVYPYSFSDEVKIPFHRAFFEKSTKVNISYYMTSTFFHLLAYHKNEEEKSEKPLSHSLKLFYDATKFIEAHYFEGITVQSICDRLHIVPDYLYKIFKQYTGISSQQYILNYKMSIACSLLEQGDIPISMVGTKVGYEDSSQFSRFFHKHIGCSPVEYRQKKTKQ